MDELLDSVREMVRRFAEAELAPKVDALETGEIKPFPLIQALCAALGIGDLADSMLRAAEKRDAAGGDGARRSHSDPALLPTLIGELARVSPGFALSFGASLGLAGQEILRLGTPAQRRRWIPGLMRGESIGAWGLTEPEAGSDAFALRTRARPDGDGWLLSGEKTFITNAPDAHVLVVYAQVDVPDAPAGKRPLAAFVVERGMPGLSTSAPFHKMGMRASPTGSIHLDGVRVTQEHLLGGAVDAHARRGVLTMLLGERVALCALGLGIMESCLARSIAYAKERTQFGQPIASFQAVQLRLARMYAAVETSRALLDRSIAGVRRGDARPEQLCAAKYTVSTLATEVALEAVQVLGGAGYMREHRVEMFARDAKLLEIGGGTSDIQLLSVARELLKTG